MKKLLVFILFYSLWPQEGYAQVSSLPPHTTNTYYCTLHAGHYHQSGQCPVCQRGLIRQRTGVWKEFTKIWVQFAMHPVISKVYFALIVPAILQGLLLSLLLWFYNPSKVGSQQRARQWLAILIGTFALHEFAYYFIQLRVVRYPIMVYFLAHSSLLGLGVALFFYITQVTRPTFKLKKKQLWHFAPALAILVGYYFLQALGIHLPHYPYSNNVLWWLQFISALHAVFYGIRSWQLLPKQSITNLKWLKRLVKGVVIVWSIRLAFSLVDALLFDYWIPNQAYYLPWILLMFLIYAIALIGFFKPFVWQTFQPEDFSKSKNTPETDNKKEVKKPPVIERDWSTLTSALTRLMEEEQLFLEPKLSLNQIAERLDENPVNISKALAQGLQTNFYDFINRYRIAQVKKLLVDPTYNHLTILGIAYESGFSAKSTFNLVFKKSTGLSPSEYKKQVKSQNTGNTTQNESN